MKNKSKRIYRLATAIAVSVMLLVQITAGNIPVHAEIFIDKNGQPVQAEKDTPPVFEEDDTVEKDDIAEKDDTAEAEETPQEAEGQSAESQKEESEETNNHEAEPEETNNHEAESEETNNHEAEPEETESPNTDTSLFDTLFSGGSGTEEMPYLIATAEDLKELSDSVNAALNAKTYAGEYFMVVADIDLSGYASWTPIGNSRISLEHGMVIGGSGDPLLGSGANPKTFQGSFDGNHKVISNMKITGGGDYKGLFGFLYQATVKNVILENASLQGESGVGVLAGYIRGNVTLSGCTVRNSAIKTLTAGANFGVGGLVGEGNYYTNDVILIENCKVTDTTVNNGGHYGRTGGLIGQLRSYRSESGANANPNVNAVVTVKDCEVRGGQVTARSGGASTYAGGLLGMIHDAAVGGNTARFIDCITDIPIDGTNAVGGLIGQIWASIRSTYNTYEIINCHAYGAVKSTLGYAGGLIGFTENYDDSNQENYITIDGCSAGGSVTSSYYYNGGLIGHMHNGTVIKNSWATGNVTGSSYSNGGLVGYSYGYRGSAGANSRYKGKCRIINSYATGNVSSQAANSGGLVGFSDNTDITNSYAIGSVKGASGSTGAFIGALYSSGNMSGSNAPVIKNSYAAGTTTGSGFYGRRDSTASGTVFENCYFDTTTTTKKSNYSVSGITALHTGHDRENEETGMINAVSFSGWDIKNNSGGRAWGSGNDSAPWYIDEEVTYPYLFYQFDPYWPDDREKVNYNLSTAKYTFTSGNTDIDGVNIRKSRADYIIPEAKANQKLYFDIGTIGAAKVYYPYLYTDFSFGDAKKLRIPASGDTTITDSSAKYSLGGMSATNIVSFDPVPYMEKTSDRHAAYNYDNPDTYTWRGDLVTYTIEIINPSIHYTWKDVVVTDYLPHGVTLVEGYYNGIEYKVHIAYTHGEGDGYYTYSKAEAQGEEDSALNFYLGDMVHSEENGSEQSRITITFTTLLDRRAVSADPENTPNDIDGDNIRNTGNAIGIMQSKWDVNEESMWEYESEFDDKNIDPVFDTYKVSYIANGGVTSHGETHYDEYYRDENGFSVKEHTNPPVISFPFVREGHRALELWYSRPEPFGVLGTKALADIDTINYEAGSLHTLEITDGIRKNPANPRQKEAFDQTDDIYADYYADRDFNLYMQWTTKNSSLKVIKESVKGKLSGAVFELERYVGSSEDYENDTENWQHVETGQTGDADAAGHQTQGEYLFGKDAEDVNTIADGIYRLRETKAPDGHVLLKAPIYITFPLRYTEGELPSGTDPQTADDTETDAEGKTVYIFLNQSIRVTNAVNIEMPKAGITSASHNSLYIVLGILCILMAGIVKHIKGYRITGNPCDIVHKKLLLYFKENKMKNRGKKKRGMRKAASLLMALLLLLGITPISAMASDQVAVYDADKEASLTITKTDNAGKELENAGYTLYKVADFVQSGGVASYVLAEDVTIVGGGTAITGDMTAEDFNVSAISPTYAEVLTSAAGIASFDVGTNHGLYIAVETTTPEGVVTGHDFIVALPMTTPSGDMWEYDVNATPKNSSMDATLEKTVTKADGTDVNVSNGVKTVHVGQNLEYTITSTLPTDFFITTDGGVDIFYQQYDIIDTPGAGLSVDDSSFTVMVDGVDITSDVVISGSGPYTFSFVKSSGSPLVYEPVHADLIAGATITITYEATVVGLEDITNDVEINYKDAKGTPGDKEPEPETPEPELFTYSHAAIKVNNKKELLNGAEFVLKLANGKYLAANQAGDGWVEVTNEEDAYVFTSGTKSQLASFSNDGFIHIIGVEGGDHQLVETKAPTGYQKLADPVSVTFDSTTKATAAVLAADDDYADEDAATTAGAYTTKIVNAAGFELPGTGGAGIYLYIAGGIGLLLAAFVLLIKARKKN